MDITLSKPRGQLQWLRTYLLYRKAFPASERKPFRIIYFMHRKGKTDLWCIRCGNRFAGFASTVNGENLILLDYLAVAPSFRGKGIGTAALTQFLSKYPGQGVFVEIEDTACPGPDLDTRLRRKAFYQNCGMEELRTRAEVFGVNMELLGRDCALDFARYKSFYEIYYSPWAAQHILPANPL